MGHDLLQEGTTEPQETLPRFFFRSVGDCLELLPTRNECCFSTAAPKVALDFGKPKRYPGCLSVGPSRTLRQKAWACAAGEHLSKLEAACKESLLAAGDDWRALSGSHRMREPSSWRGREYSKSVRPQPIRRTRGIQGGKCPTRQIFRACSTSGGGSGLVQIVSSVKSSL